MKKILAFILICLIVLSTISCTGTKNTEPKETNSTVESTDETEAAEREILTPEVVIESICDLGDFAYTFQTPGCNEVYNEQLTLSEPVVRSYRLVDNNTGRYIQLLCLASCEDAKSASEGYANYNYTKQLGAMFLFGTSEYIDAVEFEYHEYPDSFEPEKVEELDPQSVAGVVNTIEDATELCGAYYSDVTIAETKENISKKLTLAGEILNIVHLTYHDGEVLRFVYIYEFDNEADAIAYESDRCDFVQPIDNGLCIRLGNLVIYGNHGIISLLLG